MSVLEVFKLKIIVNHQKNVKFHPPKAFTLVELLVVISIIALLLSILVPSLNRARESAKKVVCKANFKQISLSVYMYANNNGDIIVPYAYSWKREDGAIPTRLFPWLLRNYAPISPKEGKGKNIYMCQAKSAYLVWDGEWNQTNYGLNSIISPHNWYEPVRKMMSVKRQADCLLASELGNFYGRVSPESKYAGLYLPEFRHSDITNCLFLDGHVSEINRRKGFPRNEKDAFWDGN